MAWNVTGPERIRCPWYYQDLIERLTGRNRFGDANYRLIWGQTDWFLCAGKSGYERRLSGCNQPNWIIQRWMPPEQFGTPAWYYRSTYDSATGLYDCGEYPYKGRYESVQPLVRKEFVNGSLVVDHLPLNMYLVDAIIPLLHASRQATELQRKAVQEIEDRKEEKARLDRLTDQMEENLPPWYGAVSFSGQGIRTSVIDRKVEQIQRSWNQVSKGFKPQKGLFQK